MPGAAVLSAPVRCPACGREIVFARSPAGKNLPLELVSARPLYVIAGPEAAVCVQSIYQNHYERCPNPEDFRKRDRSLDPPP